MKSFLHPFVLISFPSIKWLVSTVRASLSACVILQFEPPFHKVTTSGMKWLTAALACVCLYTVKAPPV